MHEWEGAKEPLAGDCFGGTPGLGDARCPPNTSAADTAPILPPEGSAPVPAAAGGAASLSLSRLTMIRGGAEEDGPMIGGIRLYYSRVKCLHLSKTDSREGTRSDRDLDIIYNGRVREATRTLENYDVDRLVGHPAVAVRRPSALRTLSALTSSRHAISKRKAFRPPKCTFKVQGHESLAHFP